MKKAFLRLALLFSAIALIAAPCAPALAGPSACPMAGCEDSPFGSISSPSCCCGAASVPVPSGVQTTLAGSQAKAPASSVGLSAIPEVALLSASADVTPAPPAPVPLFLLNSTFLI